MYTLSYSTTTAARAMHAPVPFYLAYLSGADANRVNGRACEKEGGTEGGRSRSQERGRKVQPLPHPVVLGFS